MVAVARKVGVYPDERIEIDDCSVMMPLVKAIIALGKPIVASVLHPTAEVFAGVETDDMDDAADAEELAALNAEIEA